MEAQKTAVSYTPLDPTRREIRLLHLQPACGSTQEKTELTSDGNFTDETIRCTFSKAFLDEYVDLIPGMNIYHPACDPEANSVQAVKNQLDADNTTPTCKSPGLDEAASESATVPFEALSYVWGDPKDTTPIDLEGHIFMVTKNLHSALTCLRLPDEERILWVDALCINQADLGERTHQVAGMHLVYKTACRVVIFLGAFSDTEVVLNAMEVLAVNSHLHRDPSLEPHVEFQDLGISLDEFHRSLIGLLNLPYWSRLWVIQEYVLAAEVIMQCGTASISYRMFDQFLQHLRLHTRCCELIHISLMDALNHIEVLNYCSQETRRVDLLSCMSMFRDRQCFDARDKIYGILGLTTERDVQMNFLQPDYNRPAAELYKDFFAAYVKHEGLVSILSCAHIGLRNLQHLPTFVPDWSARIRHQDAMGLLGHCSFGRVTSVYNASRATAARFSVTALGRGETVGVFVDRIYRVGKALGSDLATRDWAEVLTDWEELANTSEHTSRGVTPYASISEALRLTLTGGMIPPSKTRRSITDVQEGDSLMHKEWWELCFDVERRNALNEGPAVPLEDDAMVQYESYVCATAAMRSFIVTEKGYIGWAPQGAVASDAVVLVPGGGVPYVLRRAPDFDETGHYEYLGDGYIHGIMKGEAWDEDKLESIVLV